MKAGYIIVVGIIFYFVLGLSESLWVFQYKLQTIFYAVTFRPRKKDRDTYSRKTFEVTFSKSDDVLNFLDNLSDVKIDNAHVSKLSHTEMPKFRLDTKVAALKAAEMKAEVLLSSVGSKKGKALLIEERAELPEWLPRNLGSNAMYSNREMSNAYDSSSEGTDDVPLKKIHLRFEIMARFEIE